MSRKRYFDNPDVNTAVELPHDLAETFSVKAVELAKHVTKKSDLNGRNCQAAMYVGLSGVAYGLYYLSSLPALAQYRDRLLRDAAKLNNFNMDFSAKQRETPDDAGLLLGNSGIYMTAALIANAVGDERLKQTALQNFERYARSAIPVSFLQNGSDEWLAGRAGLLCGIYNLQRKMGYQSPELVKSLVQSTIQSGRQYAHDHKSPTPLMWAYYDTEYFGAAHGVSGILQLLLCFPDTLHSIPNATDDVRRTLGYLINCSPTMNLPPASDELDDPRSDESQLVHWCHGAPGFIYLLARAYVVFRDQRYLDATVRCGELIWTHGLLKKGPGICHGVAGNGYAFLLLYRLTKDEKYLKRAVAFANFLSSKEFTTGARRPDCPYSLYEGLAGTMCFYADLCDPMKSEFPLSPVIDD